MKKGGGAPDNASMDPRVELFLWLNGVAVLLVILFLLNHRSSGKKSRMKLKMESLDVFDERNKEDVKNLNVIFSYNAHTWDAYEVLGVPAGSSPQRVEEAYKNTLNKVEAASRPFVQAAYQAIRETWK